MKKLSLCLLFIAAPFMLGGEAAAPAGATLPPAWLPSWREPAAADRPLQIVHGIDPRGITPEGIQQVLHGEDPAQAARGRMQYYRDRGLGGIVCNVAFKDYLRSEENWRVLVNGVEACDKLGMVVWIYDEDGYPSGAAGGLVLAENREFEALELAFDAARPDPFVLRPAYEHTHASNNFYAARRYANLIDERATAAFIAKTHEAYRARIGTYFGRTVQAFFTDEPSLLAVNLGQLSEQVRKTVPVVDPVDPAVKPLPCVPWSRDLAAQYERRYGQDVMPRRRSLFGGDAAEDRDVRRRFWGLIADLVTERYFAPIAAWCERNNLASSGHTLWEEALIHHVALEGNGIKALSTMHIPGLDMLSSDPEAVVHTGWLTAAMPASAATLMGRRRVMTEVSDFIQTMGGGPPAALPEMQATAAWQAAWGVTEFTLYYGLSKRPAETYRAYGDYVGRLNAILKPARPDPAVVLYYPIYDLWAEYVPVAGPLGIESQSMRARRIVDSFMRLGQSLERNQIPFRLIDHEQLAKARVGDGGTLHIADGSFRALVLPEGVELPPATAQVAGEWKRLGGQVFADGGAGGALLDAVRPHYPLSPASIWIVLATFVRDDHRILLLVNVGKENYAGRMAVPAGTRWLALDPATGSIGEPAAVEAGGLGLSLAGRQALLLVEANSTPAADR